MPKQYEFMTIRDEKMVNGYLPYEVEKAGLAGWQLVSVLPNPYVDWEYVMQREKED